MSYRTIVWSLLVVLGASVAHADEPSPNAAIWSPPPSPIDVEEATSNAEATRSAGVALTVISVLLTGGSLVLGGVALSRGLPVDCPGPCDNASMFYAGVGLGVTASMLAAIGIPLWATGADTLAALRRHQAHLTVSADAAHGAGAAAVRWSF